MQDAAFALQTRVKRGTWKWREYGDLYLVQSRFLDELKDVLEDAGIGAIEAEHEAAIHGNTMILNSADRGHISIQLACLPVGAGLQSLETNTRGAFETDQHLRASAVAHQAEQLIVIGDGEVAFSEPP